MSSDRLSVEEAALPDITRRLHAAASDTGAKARGLTSLVNWAGTDPALSAAAGHLRTAQRLLSNAGDDLSSLDRDVTRRANLLGSTQMAQAPAPGADDDRGWTKGDRPTLLDFEWFAFLTRNAGPQTGAGWEFGAGWIHAEGLLKEDDVRGKGSSMDWFTVFAQAGALDGGRRYGVRGSAQLAALNWALGNSDSVNLQRIEMHVAQIQGEASIGSDGASFGGGASLGGAAITAGPLSKSSDTDANVRLGLSASIGAAGRLHWSDDDRDGEREYGFGVDLGPLSADVKFENPWEAIVAPIPTHREFKGGTFPTFP